MSTRTVQLLALPKDGDVVAVLRLADLGRDFLLAQSLAEGLRLLAELVVGGGDEVVPAEERELALLGVSGRLAESEPGGHPDGGAGGGTEESTSRNAAESGLIHERASMTVGGLGQSREP